MTEYDLPWLLYDGTHVLGVDAFNDADTGGSNGAGLIPGVRIAFADGYTMEVGTPIQFRLIPLDSGAYGV